MKQCLHLHAPSSHGYRWRWMTRGTTQVVIHHGLILCIWILSMFYVSCMSGMPVESNCRWIRSLLCPRCNVSIVPLIPFGVVFCLFVCLFDILVCMFFLFSCIYTHTHTAKKKSWLKSEVDILVLRNSAWFFSGQYFSRTWTGYAWCAVSLQPDQNWLRKLWVPTGVC